MGRIMFNPAADALPDVTSSDNGKVLEVSSGAWAAGNEKANKIDTILDTTLSRGRKSNTTVGTGSFAFGSNVTASGNLSHAEGTHTTANGDYSHAEGYYTTAGGARSHVDGNYTKSASDSQHVFGKYNIPIAYPSSGPSVWSSDTTYATGAVAAYSGNLYVCIRSNVNKTPPSNTDYWMQCYSNPKDSIEVVGYGSADAFSSRKNIRTLDKNGDQYLLGDLYVHADTGCISGGTKVATVADFSDADIGLTIHTTDWSATSPYTYTWTDSRITATCSVDVDFASGAQNCNVQYLDYTKATGSITFIADVQPDADLPIIIHVQNTDATNVANPSADQVTQTAISGVSDVDSALGVVDSRITSVIDSTKTAHLNSIELSPNSSTAGHGGYIDFHYNGSSEDYTSRIIETSSGNIKINGISITGLNSKIATQTVANPVTFNTTSTTSTAQVSSLSKSANVVSLHIEANMVSESGWSIVGTIGYEYKPKHDTYLTCSNLAANSIKIAHISAEGYIRIYAPDAVTYYFDITYII